MPHYLVHKLEVDAEGNLIEEIPSHKKNLIYGGFSRETAAEIADQYLPTLIFTTDFVGPCMGFSAKALTVFRKVNGKEVSISYETVNEIYGLYRNDAANAVAFLFGLNN